MHDWSENPAFWEAMEPALCAPSRLERADADVADILACVQPAMGARILDLGCGPGAHAIAFARLGHRVTGVDTSRRLLDRALAMAAHEGVQVDWVEEDMRSFRQPAGFDLVCSLYASFGFFDDRQNLHVLDNVRASLAPGGALVLDVIGRQTAARHLRTQRRHEVGSVLYYERCLGEDARSRLVSEWTVVREGVRSEFRVTQRLYSGAELRDVLRSAGFTGVELAGSLDGRMPYDDSAPRLVAVARIAAAKPDA